MSYSGVQVGFRKNRNAQYIPVFALTKEKGWYSYYAVYMAIKKGYFTDIPV